MTADLLTAGWQFHQAGDLPRAEDAYRQLVRQQPDNAQGWYLLGALCQARGDLAAAAGHLEQALRLRPAFAEAIHSRGIVHARQGQLAEATARFREALHLKPGDAEMQTNLGVALARQGEYADAVAVLQAVLRQRPHYARAQTHLAEAHSNLGTILCYHGQLEAAAEQLREALRLRPQFAEACNNLGTVLRELGDFPEALTQFALALRLKPDYADAHVNAAGVWLLLGDFARGWPAYEWRWQLPNGPRRALTQPRWDGSPVAGRTILLYPEQGLGDTLQFIRYARLLQEQGARVVVECQKPLLRLLARCPGIDQLVAQGDLPPRHDICTPLLSLPYHFETTLDTIPADVPYLEADPALVEHWRQELAARPGFKIGITWQGNPAYPADRQRSIPLAAFAPLAEVRGVRLVSLQKGPGSEQLAAFAEKWPVLDLGSRLDAAAGPFMDTAAVMKNLDLVVTSDTSIPHLAGALGVPVWVALAKVPDWRFLLERRDSPWYPTLCLFRQEQRGDWRPVFERIAQTVHQLLKGERGA